MHRRKKYMIYKRDYNPLTDTFKTRYSKYQAWKCAVRMGAGASVMACTYQHPGPFKRWTGSWSEDLWVVKAHHVQVWPEDFKKGSHA